MDTKLLACDCLLKSKPSLGEFQSLILQKNLSRQRLRLAESLYTKLKKNNIEITWFGQADYPDSFLNLKNPPVVITYFGEPVWMKSSKHSSKSSSVNSSLISVVGSREPSDESLRWMDECLAPVVSEHQLVVVSGGARGIDQKAHRLALRLGQPTVALLPSGLLNPYPKELQSWMSAIVDGGGVVVSEFHPDAPMFKSNFYQRNRLIAALGRVLLVVEARASGGTMMTAQWAAQQGVDVCAPPGHPTDSRFAGNLKLLSEGVDWVIRPEDFGIYFREGFNF